MQKKAVVFGFLGTQLDSGRGAGRWEKWRPTVSLVQHADVLVDRLELIHTPVHDTLAQQVRDDIATASPQTHVNPVRMELADPWDFGEVYAALYDWVRAYPFDTRAEQYWGPHHHRHTCGTDLPVPAGGGALHPGRAGAKRAAEEAAPRRTRQPGLHRPGPESRHQLEGLFVEVNCATLRGDGAASALFGHRKGSFTGAVADRAGLLRTAHQGLLFLDEIGELGLDEQAMLLKAIEEKRFFPVGADREVESDFQLVAGTNRDLRAEVAAGRFRDDLFARINLWTYDLPGLGQRPEDIEPNIEHLLAQHARESGRAVRFNTEARALYLRFAQSADARWSGNFRDLGASVTRLATLADGGRISEALVQAEIERLRWLWHRATPASGGEAGLPDLAALLGAQADQLDLFDRLQLQAVVQVCRGSRTLSDAGRKLFNVSREQRSVVNDADRLRKYLLRFGLSWEGVIE